VIEDKILTKHPERGKKGVNISQAKYKLIRETILDILREEGEVGFWELTKIVEKRLMNRFDGSVSWYVTTVKLDLEARDLIERVPDLSPQHLRLMK
jgi:hypothetical protein